MSWFRVFAATAAFHLTTMVPPAFAGGDEDEVFSDRFESLQISQHGITWTFDQPYTAGRFANGDWWVVGPVTILRISPPSVEVDGRVQHGSMLNPVSAGPQGYDSHAEYSYSADANVAFEVSPDQPLVLAPGSSLVSSITADEAGRWPQLDDAAVLTVLAAAPPEGSFRPPYSGPDKSVAFNADQLDYGLLDNLAPVAQTPALESVADDFQRPWIDHFPDWSTQKMAPANNMPNYGREIATAVGRAALMLHLDFSDEEKETLLIRLVQLGIDNYGVVASGGLNAWAPNGGHDQGRKWPILFAGLMLDDPDMKAIGARSGDYLYADGHGPGNPPDDYVHFGEDGQTFYVRETAPGEYHYDCGGYTAEHVGMPEWGIRYSRDPCTANVDWSASYRGCCTANSFLGFVLAARIMNAMELWNHDALFDYQDRYMDIQEPGSWQRAWDDFSEHMWDGYRTQFQGRRRQR